MANRMAMHEDVGNRRKCRHSAAMSIVAALHAATERLIPISETPRLDAELLMAHALGLSRSALLMRQRVLDVPAEFDAMLARRINHEPVAYIIGHQDFWDISLSVSPAVLIPRSDSETLIEAAIERFAGSNPPARILDLGTGSGALLLAALSVFPDATGVGVDASEAALTVAEANAVALGMKDRSEFRHLSWRDADWLENLGDRYHLILCNPPYVENDADLSPMVAEHEPHSALFAGPEGLDDYQRLIPDIPGLLAHDGVAIFEIGATQADAVSDLAIAAGLKATLKQDLAGKARALVLEKAD